MPYVMKGIDHISSENQCSDTRLCNVRVSIPTIYRLHNEKNHIALISLNIYNQKQRNYGLKINAAKTNVMKLDTTNREHVNLKDEQVQVVDTFIYLGGGVVVTFIEGCDEDIKNRLERASVKL